MSPELSPPAPLQDVPAVLQRLARLRERLATEHLPPWLDAPCQTWYLRAVARSLAQHLLDLYRRRVRQVVQEQGREALPRATRQAVTVRGTTHDRLLPLRPDLATALQTSRAARGAVVGAAAGPPLVTVAGHRAGGQRWSRRGLRPRVDGSLRRTGLKRPGLSDHALRHTAATLAYKDTRDLRAVQHMLGHADLRTTACSAHLVDGFQQNPALAVPVEV